MIATSTANLTAADCRAFWMRHVGHPNCPGDTLEDMRFAVGEYATTVLENVGDIISTGGNCEAILARSGNGLDVLITDGNGGVDFGHPHASVTVSAQRFADGAMLATAPEFWPVELDAIRAAVDAFLAMSPEAVAAAEAV